MGPGKQKKAAFMCANKEEEGRPSLTLNYTDRMCRNSSRLRWYDNSGKLKLWQGGKE